MALVGAAVQLVLHVELELGRLLTSTPHIVLTLWLQCGYQARVEYLLVVTLQLLIQLVFLLL